MHLEPDRGRFKSLPTADISLACSFYSLNFTFLMHEGERLISILRLLWALMEWKVTTAWNIASVTKRECLLLPLPTPTSTLPRGRGRDNEGGTHFWMAPPQTDRLYFKVRKHVLPSPLPLAPQSPRELCAIGIPGKCTHLQRCSYLMMHLSGNLEKGALCLENIFFPSPGKQEK